MKRTTNDGVIKAWIAGIEHGSNNKGTLTIRNGVLYSYNMPIGLRFSDGDFGVINPAQIKVSATTSAHIAAAQWATRYSAERISALESLTTYTAGWIKEKILPYAQFDLNHELCSRLSPQALNQLRRTYAEISKFAESGATPQSEGGAR